MRRAIAALLTFAWFVTWASEAHGATYYVDDANGNHSRTDAQAQSTSTPWKTITHALAATTAVTAGDTVLVRGGTYREQVAIGKYGSSHNWITVKAYTGETPIIDATEPVTGWTQAAADDPCLTVLGVVNPNYASIYYKRIAVASFPSDIRSTQIFEAKSMLTMCSDPNMSYPMGDILDDFRDVTGGDGQSTYFLDSTLTQADNYWNGALVSIMMYNDNANIVHATVGDFDHATGRVTLTGDLGYDVRCDGTWKDSYRFANHPHILNKAGEFYVGPEETYSGSQYRRIYIWPTSTGNLTSGISMPSRDYCIYKHANAAFYVCFDGFTCYGAAANGINLGGGTYPSSVGSYISIKNCTVTDTGNHGIAFDVVADSNVIDCTISRCSDHGTAGRGVIFFYPTDSYISGCTASFTSSTNLSLYNATNSAIINSEVHGIVGGHGNGTSIYGRVSSASDPNCTTCLCAGNTYYNCNAAFQYCEDITVFGNLFIEDSVAPKEAITAWNPTYNGFFLVANNTAALCYGSAMTWYQPTASWPGDAVDCYSLNNVLYGYAGNYIGNPTYHWGASAPRIEIVNQTYNVYTDYSYQQSATYGWSLGTGEVDDRSTALADLFVNPLDTGGDWSPKDGGHLDHTGTSVQALLTSLGVIAAHPEYDFTKDLNGTSWNASPSIGALEYTGAVAPTKASTPTPANSATGVSITQDLSWVDGGGADTFDVYFGKVNPPVTKVSSAQAGTTYDTGTMDYSATYYWRIDSTNDQGTTTGDVWSFGTTSAPAPAVKYLIVRKP